jgi:hypothetical protein
MAAVSQGCRPRVGAILGGPIAVLTVRPSPEGEAGLISTVAPRLDDLTTQPASASGGGSTTARS